MGHLYDIKYGLVLQLSSQAWNNNDYVLLFDYWKYWISTEWFNILHLYNPTNYGGIIVAGKIPLNTRQNASSLHDEDLASYAYNTAYLVWRYH